MPKLVKRFGAAIAFVIAAFAVVTCVAYGLGVKPYRIYVIHTASMTPTIPVRSIAIVRSGHYHAGQVISFTVEGQTVTHRLLGFDKNGLTITKGDADRTVDPWHVPKSNIVGGVVMAPQHIGWGLVYLFRTRTGGLSVLCYVLFFWPCLSYPTEVEPPADPETDKELAASA